MIRFGNDDTNWQVVGICRDAKYNDIKQEVGPTVYVPFRQDPYGSSTIVMKTVLPPLSLVDATIKTVDSIDSNVPAGGLATEEQVRDQNISSERGYAAYYGSLAAFVLLLSCSGLYGLMAYNVARRTSEFGIRMAIGATPRQIIRPILRNALLLAGAGLAFGLPMTLVLTKVIGASLYGVTVADPTTLFGAGSLLVTAMFFAAWIPARRATKVDPMTALRCD
jgi:ABC-type antimicrobial peptide transport system permease subunit